MSKLLVSILVSITTASAANAGAFIDPSDYSDSADWRSVFLTMGLFAEIICRQHKMLIAVGVTETVQPVTRWLFRIGILLLLGQLASGMFGFHWNMAGAGFTFLVAWAALRSAQALYLSGCDRSMKEGDRIKQKLADQESHT